MTIATEDREQPWNVGSGLSLSPAEIRERLANPWIDFPHGGEEQN